MSEIGTLAGANTLIGRVLDDRYALRSVLGVGGMGAVYRAEQLSMGREVAVKVLRGDRAHDEQAVRRFLTEARATSRLKSPHTVSAFDFGRTHDGILFLVMELLEGRTLADVLEQEGIFVMERAVRVIHQVLDALEEAHASGILHRDIKPENIFLLEGPGGREFVKVLDFGVAKMLFDPRPGQTLQGVAFGTLEYMSPEQMMGRPVGPTSDLYEVAILLFQMLCGRPPFEGVNPVDVALRKIEGPIPMPRDILPSIPSSEAMEEFFRVALAPSPEDRYPDVETFRAAMKLMLREAHPAGALAEGAAPARDTLPDPSPPEEGRDTLVGVPRTEILPESPEEARPGPVLQTIAMAPFGEMQTGPGPVTGSRTKAEAMTPPKPPEGPASPVLDRRKRPRRPRLTSVLCVQQGGRHKAILAELSLGGAFVHSRWLPAPGSEVAIVFPPPAGEELSTVVIRSEVLRIVEVPTSPGEVQGFSVRFRSLRTQGAIRNLQRFFWYHFRFRVPTDLPEDRKAALWEWSFDSQSLKGVGEE